MRRFKPKTVFDMTEDKDGDFVLFREVTEAMQAALIFAMAHQDDIESDINDFGDLKPLLDMVTGGSKDDLIMIRDVRGIVNRKKGETLTYNPWKFSWQDMSEPERVDKGIYIHCFGHGEFEKLVLGVDIELIDMTKSVGSTH